MDVALAAGAHGVHLRGDSIGTVAARRLAPAGFLVGRSAHSADEAARAADEGADYVVVGTVFETVSKPGVMRPVSRCSSTRSHGVRRRYIAIGGMTATRAGDVAATGAAGMAAIGMFMGEQGDAAQVQANLHAMVAGIRRAFEARARENRAWP